MVSFGKWNQLYPDLQVPNYSDIPRLKLTKPLSIIRLIGLVIAWPTVITMCGAHCITKSLFNIFYC
jgi:hypothetical protein